MVGPAFWDTSEGLVRRHGLASRAGGSSSRRGPCAHGDRPLGPAHEEANGSVCEAVAQGPPPGNGVCLGSWSEREASFFLSLKRTFQRPPPSPAPRRSYSETPPPRPAGRGPRTARGQRGRPETSPLAQPQGPSVGDSWGREPRAHPTRPWGPEATGRTVTAEAPRAGTRGLAKARETRLPLWAAGARDIRSPTLPATGVPQLRIPERTGRQTLGASPGSWPFKRPPPSPLKHAAPPPPPGRIWSHPEHVLFGENTECGRLSQTRPGVGGPIW